ncbi:hypothetical protein [Alkalihalobacillus deserti]|nr:hypothetical protein [Alkalihalobacillus deserti]
MLLASINYPLMIKKIIKNYLDAFKFEDFHHGILKQLTDKVSDPRKNLVV